ncbi:hypothetical protein LL243_002464 [Salmonella enterica]|nr:hypothetical protein [Salmonella enterica]
MRKAVIQLNDVLLQHGKPVLAATLIAGKLGYGRELFAVIVSIDTQEKPSTEIWRKALDLCLEKAEEMRFEVVHIYGQNLANYVLDKREQDTYSPSAYLGEWVDEATAKERRNQQGIKHFAELKAKLRSIKNNEKK